jgi:hypothetical protein
MKIDPYKHKEKYLAWKASVNGRIMALRDNPQLNLYIISYKKDNGAKV